MEFVPSIDLLAGKVVRLKQGDYDQVTVFRDSALEVAKEFLGAGATRIHLVDLEGARSGTPGALATIGQMAKLGARVQVGGGVRSLRTAEAFVEAGADRVVFGTLAISAPEVVSAFCRAHPERGVVAVDSRGGRVQTDGWTRTSETTPSELGQQADEWGAVALLFTAIERDGMGEGPDVALTKQLQQTVRATVIASGGVGSLAHLQALKEAGVRSAISGRALYEQKFTPREALEVCAAK